MFIKDGSALIDIKCVFSWWKLFDFDKVRGNGAASSKTTQKTFISLSANAHAVSKIRAPPSVWNRKNLSYKNGKGI